MEIKTKYDIGQKVWFMEQGKATEREITGIHYYNREGKEQTEYVFKTLDNGFERIRYEKEVFATKEELIKSL